MSWKDSEPATNYPTWCTYFDSRCLEVSYDPEQGLGTVGYVEFSVHHLAKIDREEWPQIHFEGPDPISPHVYWWRAGEISE